ncbi:hypothetical protein PB1_06442 [Bacillus methanolicus PB1]|uniref:Uncharacterized protein n=1 Tax=Bacillus methanolicus PB1 TaxID=997296 RepID=I3E0F7_BACMT|nr:hypothetical protein [Bacillus methanolicus]EIJ79978.1 hypothetical protein PB1_06442 [Bacillus methanolicus PB1]
MIGILVNEKEVKELQYLMKREMDEILFELNDERIEHIVKSAMQERYKVLFSLFKRIASPSECLKYLPAKSQIAKK